MEISVETIEGVSVSRLSGRLDASSSSETATELDSALDAGRGLVVSMENLDYISSSGLRVLLKIAKRARTEGKGLCLASLTENVREVFDISGFTALFDIAEGVEEAVKVVVDESSTG